MGGLIIQSALLELLAPSGSMRTVDHIRQVMLFATPTSARRRSGSCSACCAIRGEPAGARALTVQRGRHPDSQRDPRPRDHRPPPRPRPSYPIPFCTVWAAPTLSSTAESAVGHHGTGEPLPGDHFTVHCPAYVTNRGTAVSSRGCTTRTDTRTSGRWSDHDGGEGHSGAVGSKSSRNTAASSGRRA